MSNSTDAGCKKHLETMLGNISLKEAMDGFVFSAGSPYGFDKLEVDKMVEVTPAKKPKFAILDLPPLNDQTDLEKQLATILETEAEETAKLCAYHFKGLTQTDCLLTPGDVAIVVKDCIARPAVLDAYVNKGTIPGRSALMKAAMKTLADTHGISPLYHAGLDMGDGPDMTGLVIHGQFTVDPKALDGAELMTHTKTSPPDPVITFEDIQASVDKIKEQAAESHHPFVTATHKTFNNLTGSFEQVALDAGKSDVALMMEQLAESMGIPKSVLDEVDEAAAEPELPPGKHMTFEDFE